MFCLIIFYYFQIMFYKYIIKYFYINILIIKIFN